jgi:predicted DNA-binding transcriptional regulator AlpA
MHNRFHFTSNGVGNTATGKMQLLTEKQLVERLNISASMARKMRAEGTGPDYVKIGSSIRYPQTSLDDYLRERTISPRRAA